MSGLTLFGLFAVSAMLVCYAFENRNVWFICICHLVRPRPSLRFFARRLAVWISRNGMGSSRFAPLAPTTLETYA